MSLEVEKMTDEEIIKWQERVYDLESNAMAGPPMTEEEQMEKIREYLAPDYYEKLAAKVRTKRMQLLSAAVTPEAKEQLSPQIAQLEEIEQELLAADRARAKKADNRQSS